MCMQILPVMRTCEQWDFNAGKSFALVPLCYTHFLLTLARLSKIKIKHYFNPFFLKKKKEKAAMLQSKSLASSDFYFQECLLLFLRKWKKSLVRTAQNLEMCQLLFQKDKSKLSILWKGRMDVRQQNHQFVFWKNVACNSSGPQWQALYLSPYYAFNVWNVICWPPKAWRILFCISHHEWFFGRVMKTLEFSFSFPYEFMWEECLNRDYKSVNTACRSCAP